MNYLIIFGAKYLIYVLILFAAVYIFVQDGQKRRNMAIFALAVLPLSYIVAKISSLLYYDQRPFVIGNFIPLIPHISDNGFPSDHTLLASAVASVILFFNKKIGIGLFALALIVGISRVLAGVHHAVDVLASCVIAVVVSYLVNRWIMRRFENKS